MRHARPFLTACLLLSLPMLVLPALAAQADETTVRINKIDRIAPQLGSDEKTSDGTVTVGGQPISYQAVAGTIVVHPKGWDDAVRPDPSDKGDDKTGDAANPTAEASMFFVAYLRKGIRPEVRPITFLFNGGPGSSTVWLHMGALGPRRVVTADHAHGPAAPYRLVGNAESLLDASDLVFIDAPGTGFSRIAGRDKEKEFFGVDQDAHAFEMFITGFLSRFGRWNSPKYLFGESYGTTRAAVLANLLQGDADVDLNGVMLLSQALNFDAGNIDDPEANPGIDLPYVAALPTYAATAWYHHRLPGQVAGGAAPDLDQLLAAVERFADTDYTVALEQGAALDPARRDAVARQLNLYTGLPVQYLRKANLRVDGGMFERMVVNGGDTVTGRYDTRFTGPTTDPLAKQAEYDPQSTAIGSAFVSAFNDYVRRQLGYGDNRTYRPEIEVPDWDMKHLQPSTSQPQTGTLNVMPDLAAAMTANPTLRVQLNQGYFDLATPYYEGVHEMRHLPMPAVLQANIEYRRYRSGHMVYANEDALRQLHDNAADFIRRTEGTAPTAR